MERRLYLVDSETGEVCSEIRSRRASSESDGEPDGGPQERPEKSERFARIMVEVWRHVSRAGVFTAAEERVLQRLALWLQLNTNAIVTAGGDYMTIEDMARQISLDRTNTRKVVKQLMRKNAIGMWRSGDREIYYINPFLYRCGEIKPQLYWLFDDEYHERCKREHVKRFKAGKVWTSILQPSG